MQTNESIEERLKLAENKVKSILFLLEKTLIEMKPWVSKKTYEDLHAAVQRVKNA